MMKFKKKIPKRPMKKNRSKKNKDCCLTINNKESQAVIFMEGVRK